MGVIPVSYTHLDVYKRQACNNLGFCAFMRMDFEQAEKYYQEVYSLTKNELELQMCIRDRLER